MSRTDQAQNTKTTRSGKTRGLVLLASVSALSLLSAFDASAACLNNGPNPINNIQGGDTVSCVGVNNGVVIAGTTANNGNNTVEVLPGATLSNATINVTQGFDINYFRSGAFSGGSTLTNVSVAMGPDAQIDITNGTATNLAVTEAGRIVISGNAAVTAAAGGLLLTGTGGGQNFNVFGLGAGSSLSIIGPSGGQSMVTGSGFAELVSLAGSIVTGTDGRVMSLGGGTDDVEIENTAAFAGATGAYVFDGGAGTDTLRLASATGAFNHTLNLVNFENLRMTPTNAGVSTANINGSINNIILNGTGEVRWTNAAGIAGPGNLGVNNATIFSLDTGAGNLTIDRALGGGGAARINVLGTGTTTFNGSGSNFIGVLGLVAGTTVLGTSAATGNYSIVNNAALQFGDFAVGSLISGTGTVTKTGTGVGTLTGSNSYSGGTTIAGGTLRITRANAIGTGPVVANAGTALDLAFTHDGSFNQSLSGAGALRKSGTSTVDVLVNQTHTGGTFIDGGVLRTDAISRLGTGPITATAGATFALNHNSNINQTTSFLLGAGQFEKLGSGILTLNAANGFTGGSIISQGAIDLVNNQGLGTGAITVGLAGSLSLNSGVIVNNVNGLGQVRKVGTGLVQLSGVNSFSGGLFIDDGTLSVTSTAALGGGLARISSPAILQLDATAGDINLSADLFGSGRLLKTGNDRLVLSGDNSNFTGIVQAFEGVVEVGSALSAGGGQYTLNPNGVLNLNYAADGSFSNNIIGGGAVLKTGAGIVDLTGTNSYSGGTIIDGGSIRVTDFAKLGTGLTTANAGASLILNYNGPAVLISTPFLAGAGSFVKEGNGDIVIGTANTWTGGTRIAEGRIALNDALGLGTGNIQVDANGILNIGSINFGNLITGNGIVRKTGGGVGALTGDNSGFSGDIQIQDGQLNVSTGAALGTGQVTIATGAELLFDASVDQTLTSVISGDGNFTKDGSARLVLTGNNAISGTLNVNNGLLQVSGGNNIGSASINLINASAGLELNGASGTSTFSNAIFGAGSLTKIGNGDVILSGVNTYSGGTNIVSGALRINDVSALGTGAVSVQAGAFLDFIVTGSATWNAPINGAGTLRKSGIGDLNLVSNSLSGGLDIQAGRVVVTDVNAVGSGSVTTAAQTALVLNTSTVQVLSTSISGAGSLVKDGTGTIVVQSANSFTGGTTINSGGVTLNNGQGLGSGEIVIASGASLGIGGITLANNVSGAGTIDKTANNTATLTGTNTHSGGTNVQGGSLQIASVAALGTGSVDLATGTSLVTLGNGNETLANTVSGAGSLTKHGSGILTLKGSNAYSGVTKVSAGRLHANAADSLGTSSAVLASGAQLSFGDFTLANTVSGAGTLIKTGTGTGSLTGVNTHHGGVDIQAGRLSVTNVSALGTGGVTTAAQTALVLNNINAQTLTNSISGTGSLVMDGTGALVIQNANTFSGGTSINVGEVTLNNGQGLGTGGIVVASGARLGIGGIVLANNVSGAGLIVKTTNNTATLTGTNTHSGGTEVQNGTLEVATTAALGTGSVSLATGTTLVTLVNTNQTLANTVFGAGSLTKQGSGVLTLTGSNAYSGLTTVSDGRLHASAANSLGTSSATIASGAQLSFSDFALANSISGAGTLIKTGTGTGSLTGNNTHSGGTLVSAGTLAVSSLSPLGSGGVQIDGGATLALTNAANIAFSNTLSGTGALRKLGAGQLLFGNNFSLGSLFVDAGAARINAIAQTNVNIAANAKLDGTGRIIGNLFNDGLLAPGNSIGTLTVQGNYTSGAGSVLEIEFDGSGNIDLLDITGSATLTGGTLRFLSVGGAEGTGGTFLRAAGGLTGTFATVETVGAALPLSVIYESNAAKMAPSVLTARPSTFNAQVMAASSSAFAFSDMLGDIATRPIEGRRVWVQGFASNGDRSASGTTLAYDHKASGASVGISAQVNQNVTIGAAYGWSKSDITLGSGGGGGDQDINLGSAFINVMAGKIGLTAGMFYGNVDQSTLRNVSFNGFSGSVSGVGEADLVGGFAGLSVPFGKLGEWSMNGLGRVTYVTMSQDAYRESGTSPLRLEVAARDAETMESQLGLQGIWGKKLAERGGEETGARIDVSLEAGYRYLSTMDNRSIPVRFAVSNAGIDLQGDTRDSGHAYLGGRLDWTANARASFNIGYRGQYGETQNHVAQIGVALKF